MRIDFLTDLGPSSTCSSSLVFRQLVDFFKGRGHRVSIRNAENGTRLFENEFAFAPDGEDDASGVDFKVRWRKKRPDIVYLALRRYPAAELVRIARCLEIPVVLDLRAWGKVDEEFDHMVAEVAEIGYSGLQVLVLHESAAEVFKSMGFFQVTILDQGVDRRLFHPVRRDEELRAAWGCGDSTVVFGMVGTFDPDSKCYAMLDRFRRLKLHWGERVSLVISGEGCLLPSIRDEFPDVIFLPVRSLDERARCLASMDVLLCPGTLEAGDCSFREALSSGLVVIHPGEEPSLDREMNPVCTFRVGDDYACLSMMEQLVLSEGELDRWREAARELSSSMDLRKIHVEVEQLLKKCLLQPKIKGSGRAPRDAVHSCRTVFLSDIHLGTKDCKADECRRFLKHIRAEKIVLVGDIVDAWALSRGSVWQNKHGRLVRALLRKIDKEQTEVIYLRGNHDEVMEKFMPLALGKLKFMREYMHTTRNGRSYLCVHGDGFDGVCTHFRCLAVMGSLGYDVLLWVNRIYNRIRAWQGREYYSISKVIKGKVKSAVSFMGNYEKQLEMMAHRRKCDGIIAGHVHHGADKLIGNVHYLNCGDWVESLTAIIEENDGQVKLVSYDEWMRRLTVDHSVSCEL